MVLAYTAGMADGDSLALNLVVGAIMALLFVWPIWVVFFLWQLKKAFDKKKASKSKKPALKESDTASIQEKPATPPAYEHWKSDVDQSAAKIRAKIQALDDKIKTAANLRKAPTQAELNHAEALLSSAKCIADTLNTTTNPALFFTQYDQLLETLEELSLLEKTVDMDGTLPSITLAELKTQERRDAVTCDFLTRYKDSSTLSAFDFRGELKPYWDRVPAKQAAQIEAACKAEEERQRQEEAAKEAELLEVRRKWKERRQKEIEEERQKQLLQKENNIKLEQAAERGRRNIHAARVEFVQNQEKTAEDIAAQERQERAVRFSAMPHDALLLEAGKFAATHVFVSVETLSDWLAGVDVSEIEALLRQLKDYRLIEETADHKKFWSSLDEREFLTQLKNKMSEPNTLPPVSERMDSEMDGVQFEHYCADLLLRNGFSKADVTQASGDYGIDIKAEKDGITYGIQCKYYTDKVGNHAVQEALSGAQYYHCMVAAVITNNYFTPAAIETAKKTNVLLWDKEKLADFQKSAQS